MALNGPALQPLALRTYGLFFETIELLLTGGLTLVAEAAFQHALWWQRIEPLQRLAALKVWTSTPSTGGVPAWTRSPHFVASEPGLR